jgi:hypothetical protein
MMCNKIENNIEGNNIKDYTITGNKLTQKCIDNVKINFTTPLKLTNNLNITSNKNKTD